MTTLRQWLNEFSEQYGEITHIVVGGESSWGDCGLESWPSRPADKVVAFNNLPPAVLDHPFDSGFGAPGCPAVHAWAETWVFGIDCYDGATHWFAVPRSPQDCKPSMPGGG